MPHFKPAHVSRNRQARVIGVVERRSSFEKQNNAGQGISIFLPKVQMLTVLAFVRLVGGKFIERDLIIDGDEFQEGKMGRPRLSIVVLLYEPAPIIDKTTIMPQGCAFDLDSRSGLLPGQADESPLEYDDYVPIDHIVCCDNCCCGQIPRYGLVFLVSRHHQEIIIGRKLPEAVTSIIMETTLGRFTYYTRDDRNFVHFDTNICLSNTPLIPNQNMDHIRLSAQGYYLIYDSVQSKNFVWRQCYDPLEFLVSGNFFGVPDAVIYMPSVILKKWKRIERFSRALHDAVTSVLGDISEPDSFAIALKNLPEDDRSSIKNCIQMRTTAERLAACVCLCRALSRRNLIEMDFDSKFFLFSLETL